MANELVAMDRDVICKAVTFLMSTQKSGMFTEVGNIVHGEMIVRNDKTCTKQRLCIFVSHCVVVIVCNSLLHVLV